MNQAELIQKELEIEEDYRYSGYTYMRDIIYKARSTAQVDVNLSAGQGMFHWKIYNLNQAILEEVKRTVKPKPGTKPACLSIIQDMTKEFTLNDGSIDFEGIAGIMSTITLSTVINQLCIYGEKMQPISNIAYLLVKGIENEYRTRAFANWLEKQDNPKIKNALKGIDKRVGEDYRKEYLAKAIKLCGYKENCWHIHDQKGMRALGTILLHIAQEQTGYFEICSAKHIQPYMMATEYFNEAWQRNEDNMLRRAHKLCPMVVPPAPWTGFADGGYIGALAEFNSLLRLKEVNSIFGEEYMGKFSTIEAPGVYKAVNALQATPWKINTQVLDVLKLCREQGYIPNGKEKANGYVINLRADDRPPKPAEGADEETIKHYREVAANWYKGEKRRLSIQNRANAIINTADKFKDYENIYFPCNMDFRGRIYFIPVFSPQGDDLCKGLLLFSNVPPCTSQEDLDWLAIAGANFAGVDKVSYKDRIQWVYDNESYILASAEDPMGCQWWMSVDDHPVELLAWCFEWKKAKDYMSEHNGSIVGFTTGIPYAQDGTCSGLQHFSGMLRDPAGAEAVNLLPQDKPNDVYRMVADKVNVVLKADAVNGTPDEWKEDKLILGTKSKAQIWLSYAKLHDNSDGIKRSVTKRCTMTLAYGAKKFGYKEMLIEDIIRPAMEREMKDCCPFTHSNATQCAVYMAGLIWDAVGKTVVKAVEGMAWLQEVAKIVAKDANVVSWTTPMGLLLQQNYAKYDLETVKLRCMGKRYAIYVPKTTGEVDTRKQSQAIAPNFVHSMDACHLQMTMCASVDKGIHHFAMIHDSYGCPISQAKTMYDVVRDCFVKMYTEFDVLQRFKEEMQELTDTELPDPPSKGNFDLEQIRGSKYIFC